MLSTLSLPAELLGVQLPRVSSAPPSTSTAGVEVVELAASVGLVLDPWQEHAVKVALAERPDGRWSAFEVGILVARQNGKGAILEAIELAALYLFGERLILHSAHEFKTAQEAFLRLKALIDNSDDLRKRVARVRTSHGEEGFEMIGGQRLRFVARSRSSGRGFSGDRLILDEAQELPRSAMGALLPTMSARPNPQVIYTGTVPGANNDSAHFASVRDRGRLGGDSSLAWLEWSPGDEVEDLDDLDAWAAANPALGHRITEETIQRERNSLGEEEFARERLSIWSGAKQTAVIDPRLWSAAADAMSRVLDPVAFAIDVTPDRSAASIALAGRRKDKLRHVEVVENKRGTGWVVERVAQLKARWAPCAIVLDASGPAGSLIPALSEAGAEPMVTSAREMGQACGSLFDLVAEGGLRHINQPALNGALGAAKKRLLGDSWAWHRKDSNADISPLVAVTLALYAHEVAISKNPPPTAPRRIR